MRESLRARKPVGHLTSVGYQGQEKGSQGGEDVDKV